MPLFVDICFPNERKGGANLRDVKKNKISKYKQTKKEKEGERTMKTLKRLATVLLAVMLLATMLVIPANAAGDYTITINGTAKEHTYSAYKIFGGTLSTSGATEGVLSNIVWGNGVDGPALLTALQGDATFGVGAANEFSSSSTAVDVSKVVATWSPDSTKLDRFAEQVGANLGTAAGTSTFENETPTTYTISNLEEGYYLVVDTGSLNSGNHDSYTKYILRVVKNVEVSPKGSVPTVTKLVKTDADTAYLTHTDAAITHTIHFQLEGTLPDNYESDYARYYYQFKDTLDDGFTIDQGNCIEKVYILHSNSAKTNIDPSKYVVAVNGQVLTVTFDNLKEKLPTLRASDKLVVEYKTTLNTNAKIGSDGNRNNVVVIYSNDPNEPAVLPDGVAQRTGTTPASSAIVYSFELDITKVDGAKTTTKLPGAQFKLYRNDYKDGAYKPLYVIADEDGVITNTTYDETLATTFTSYVPADESPEEQAKMGKFTITGLDANLYHLEEITAPAGYNKMEDPVRVTITPVYTGSALTGLNYDVDSVSGTGDYAHGIVSINVRNNAGSTLPSTGGMGTTLFYVVGTGLMLSAAAILLAKKRFARG